MVVVMHNNVATRVVSLFVLLFLHKYNWIRFCFDDFEDIYAFSPISLTFIIEDRIYVALDIIKK